MEANCFKREMEVEGARIGGKWMMQVGRVKGQIANENLRNVLGVSMSW